MPSSTSDMCPPSSAAPTHLGSLCLREDDTTNFGTTFSEIGATGIDAVACTGPSSGTLPANRSTGVVGRVAGQYAEAQPFHERWLSEHTYPARSSGGRSVPLPEREGVRGAVDVL